MASKPQRRLSSKKQFVSANGSKVMAAATTLDQAHTRHRELKRELRRTEGDMRRALSLLKKLTAPAPRRAPPFMRSIRRQPLRE